MSDITVIVDRVTSRFPRVDTTVTAQVTSDIYEWIKDICSEFPFWFLRIDPGDTFPTARFPIADITDVAGYTHYKTNWLDRGWLHAVEGREKYPLSAPAAQGQYDTDAAKWSDVTVQKVQYVKEFDARGSMRMDLEVHMSSRSMSRAHYSQNSRPTKAYFESGLASDGSKVSWLRLNPIPDKDYIYAVSFILDRPINYGSPVTNRFIQEEQELVINLGMMFAAEYMNELRAYEFYHRKLYGNPEAPTHSGRRYGLIEKAKRKTRSKTEQEAQTIPQFKGAAGAVGRVPGAPGYQAYRGSYYGKDGFS